MIQGPKSLVKSATDGCLAPGAVVSIETMKCPMVKIAHAQLTPTIASATARAFGSSAPGSASSLCSTSASGRGVSGARSVTSTNNAMSPPISR